jgi:hypothetical protein
MIKIQKETEQFPSNAKLWFYWVPRPLKEDELTYLQLSKKDFLSQWNTHGKANSADVWLIEDRCILIVAGNEFEGVSGCSIDKSVAWIKGLSTIWNVDLLDRNWVMYQAESKEWVMSKLSQFWALRKANVVHDQTLILDSTITQFSDVENLIKPFAQSWHAQMWL